MSDTEIRMMRYTIEQLSAELQATRQYVSDIKTELERTRKALDVAVDALKNMNEIIKNYEYGNGLYYALDGHDTMLIAEYVEKSLDQITALEQKEVK